MTEPLTKFVLVPLTDGQSDKLDQMVQFFRDHGIPDMTRQGVARLTVLDAFIAFDEVQAEAKD